MSGQVKSIDVVAGIVWKGESILCCQRPRDKAQAGFWEFPGGKIEPGETPREALGRELEEELGISVKAASFWRQIEHVYPERNLHVRLRFFHVDSFEGAPRSKEGQAMAFMPLSEAPSLAFLAADLPIVEELSRKGRQA